MNWIRRKLGFNGAPRSQKEHHSNISTPTSTSSTAMTDTSRTHVAEKQLETNGNMGDNNTTLAKILTVGVNDVVVTDLEQARYRVQNLELGCPFYFEPEAGLRSLPPLDEFPPDYKEHEIVVVDQTREAIPHESLGMYPAPAKGVNAWWGPNDTGRINPSLLHALSVRDAFDRILSDGGIFIIFLGEPETQDFCLGANSSGFYGLDVVHKVTCTSFGFLSALGNSAAINFKSDTGKSIELAANVDPNSLIGRTLRKYSADSIFHCVISKGYSKNQSWQPVLVNKFGDCVGALMSSGKGFALLLPDLADKAGILKELLSDVLPEMAPALFPNLSKSTWTTDAGYEPSDIVALSEKIVSVRERAAEEIRALEEGISARRQEISIQFDLARETGDGLVSAVKHAFETLGFSKVIDSDENLRAAGVTRQNREDLQILDYETTLIVEVKGIGGFPSDDDALAVQKYVVLRMREWQKTNVKGLAIINHQRGMAPLSRENEKPFRDDLVTMAREQQIGLLTGWNLFRLLRSFVDNQWQHSHIKDIFFRDGYINILPSHYELLGTVERHIPKANVIGVRLTAPLRTGDKLGYELPVAFYEELCNSPEVDNRAVQSAEPGALVGIRTQLKAEDVKVGMTVYKVQPN